MLARVEHFQALSNEAIQRIVHQICAAQLDQAERERIARPARPLSDAKALAVAETARADDLRAALARNDYSPVETLLADALARYGITLASDSLDFRQAARAVIQGMIRVHDCNARRELGDYGDGAAMVSPPSAIVAPPAFIGGGTPGALSAMDPLNPAIAWPNGPFVAAGPFHAVNEGDGGPHRRGPATQPAGDAADDDESSDDSMLDRPFSELFCELVAYKTEKTVEDITATLKPGFWRTKRYESRSTRGEWGPDAEHDALTALRYFIEACGDKPARSVTKKTLRRFREELQKLPKYHGKGKFAGLTVPESIRLADETEARQVAAVEAKHTRGKLSREARPVALAKARVPRLSMPTINKHMGYVNRVFVWLNDVHDIDTPNRARGLFYKKKTWQRRACEQRPQYSEEDLRAVFLSPLWTGCHSPGRRSRPGSRVIKDALYWSLLIESHAGLRLEETAQLWLEDIEKIDGIWCFLVCNGVDRSTKTSASTRAIPIHPVLIKLGLLDRVERLKRAGYLRLFPELDRDISHGRYGSSLSGTFAWYLKNAGLYVPTRVHHSARHTFDTTLLNAGVAEIHVSELMGHARAGETKGRYYKGARLARLKEAIETIDYGLPMVERNGEWHIANGELERPRDDHGNRA